MKRTHLDSVLALLAEDAADTVPRALHHRLLYLCSAVAVAAALIRRGSPEVSRIGSASKRSLSPPLTPTLTLSPTPTHTLSHSP